MQVLRGIFLLFRGEVGIRCPAEDAYPTASFTVVICMSFQFCTSSS